MAGVGSYRQIMLVKHEPQKDADGHWIEDAETRYPLWAEIERKSGSRFYKDGQTQLVNLVKFKVRFNPALNPDADYKIIYSGRKHTIHSIEKDKEKRFYWIINAQSIDDK